MKLKKSLLHHILTLHQFNFTQVLLCKPTINFGNVLNTELFASLRNAWDKPISYPVFWLFGQRGNAKKPGDSGYENERGRKEWEFQSRPQCLREWAHAQESNHINMFFDTGSIIKFIK